MYEKRVRPAYRDVVPENVPEQTLQALGSFCMTRVAPVQLLSGQLRRT